MCSLCGWQMGKVGAFVSGVVPTELAGLFPVSLPVYHTQNRHDPGLDEDFGAAPLSASVLTLLPQPWGFCKHRASRNAFPFLADH